MIQKEKAPMLPGRPRSTLLETPETYFVTRDQVDHIQQVILRTPNAGDMSLTHIVMNRPGQPLSMVSPTFDGYLVSINLSSSNIVMCAVDGETPGPRTLRAGQTAIYDLKQSWATDVIGPVEIENFLIPRLKFNEPASGRGHGSVLSLATQISDDPVLYQIGLAFLPRLASPNCEDPFRLEKMFETFISYLASAYGELKPRAAIHRRGLTGWQEGRAKQFLSENLAADIALSAVANACGLSAAHFAREFKLSTGVTPFRWRTLKRVECAKSMLHHSAESLSTISKKAGFSNQSHFTSVFTREVGISPGGWRRMRNISTT